MIILPGKKNLVIYQGTASALRISSVDGTAFLDNLPAAVLALSLNGTEQIEIYDSTGKMLRGVLKAVGVAETLDSEKVTNGTFETGDPPTGWDAFNGATLSQAADPRTGSAGSSSLSGVRGTGDKTANRATASLTVGWLLKYDLWLRKVTGNVTWQIYSPGGNSFGRSSDLTSTSWTNDTLYFSKTVTEAVYLDLFVKGVAGNEARFDDLSMKQVLTPSNSGATIVSAKEGTTYNFGVKQTGFAYNEATYQLVVRKLR